MTAIEGPAAASNLAASSLPAAAAAGQTHTEQQACAAAATTAADTQQPQQPPQPAGAAAGAALTKSRASEQQQQQDSDEEDDNEGTVPAARHPYGVQPWGNFYLSGVPEIRTAGLGRLAALPDALVLEVCYGLPARDLVRLGLVSKALYCFAHTNDLWKALVLQELAGEFDWCGSWRETFLAQAPASRGRYVRGSHRPLRVAGFYSDLLHQPWLCASIGLDPAWLEVDNIDRRPAVGLTPAEFRAEYEARNRPVLLEGAAAGWPALAKWADRGYLAAAFAGRPVIVGNAAWRYGAYSAYCASGAADDEMPLYLFDKAFASSAPHLAADYSVPHVFTEELFEVLGEEARPDYRWLIVGPHRSGSSFHVDPNATCAWNATVVGAKKWIMLPPGTPPPGVHPSPDGADVAAPVSVIEWLLNFYAAARDAKVPPIECISRPGDVVYVPRGWWHCVLNLGWTVAVTQNYVSSSGLPAVLDFLAPHKGHVAALVSGCQAGERASLHDRFVAALEEQRPDVVEGLRARRAAAAEARAAQQRLSQLFRGARAGGGGGAGAPTDGSTEAADAAGGAANGAGGGGFSFGFQLGAGDGAGGGEQQPAQASSFAFGFQVDAAAGSDPEGQQKEAGGQAGVKRLAGEEEAGGGVGAAAAAGSGQGDAAAAAGAGGGFDGAAGSSKRGRH